MCSTLVDSFRAKEICGARSRKSDTITRVPGGQAVELCATLLAIDPLHAAHTHRARLRIDRVFSEKTHDAYLAGKLSSSARPSSLLTHSTRRTPMEHVSETSIASSAAYSFSSSSTSARPRAASASPAYLWPTQRMKRNSQHACRRREGGARECVSGRVGKQLKATCETRSTRQWDTCTPTPTRSLTHSLARRPANASQVK